MELEALTRVMKQARKAGITSDSSDTYVCKACQDTGWVRTIDDSYRQCSCMELKFIKLCWENYGVRPEEVKPLREYAAYNKVCAAAKTMAAGYIKEFKDIAQRENNWFGLFGQPGAGKTHIAIAVGAALLNREDKPVKAVYMPYLEVMRELKANTQDDEYYINLLGRYKRADLLIIDDLFKDKVKNGRICSELTKADINHIAPLLNHRYYKKLPTIISSECTPYMLVDLDEALGSRIMQRCDENYVIFSGKEFNYRLRKFQKQSELKA